ncbi:hypothetical protein [Streptomyces globosus]|uniref:hypothetical protein n=1 Tax=Streptomyces globosus TaxID=68209 RepID=UPI0031D236CA
MTSREQLPPSEKESAPDPVLYAAAQVAMQWKDLDAAQLAAAMSAMEPSLVRDYHLRQQRIEMQREAALWEQADRQQRREYRRRMTELIVGGVVALAMLGGGVYLAAADHWWMATLMAGPSLIALVKIFVLRRSDPGDMHAVASATRMSTSAGTPQAPPPVV